MTTCVVSVNPFRDPFMMGVNPRQIYQEQEEKAMNGGLMDLKQVHDNSYWFPPSASARPNPTATDRLSPSPLRALLQQPPPLSLVPDTSSESDTIHNGAIQSSWPPCPEQANFQSPKVRSLRDSSTSASGQMSPQYNALQSISRHQFGHQGVDLQQPPSNNYHVNHSNRAEARQQLPLSSSQEQSGLEQQLHERRVLQRERMNIHEFPSAALRMGSSLPKELDKIQMMAVAQQQMSKIRLKRRKSFDQDKQLSLLPEGAGGSKLKFGCTADGIRNGPDNHSMLRQQQQQSEPFPRGFLSPANQIHDQDLNTSTGGSLRTTFSTEAKIHVEDADAMVMKQFQERVSQLDIGARLSLQESLYRLARNTARNARERQEETRASTGTSAENEYHAAMIDMDNYDSGSDRPHSRVRVETQTNPTDRILVSMMSTPSRVPGLQNPGTEHRPPSWTRSRPAPVATRSSQVSCPVNWSWPSSKSSNWGNPGDPADSSNMVHTQFHGRDGSGVAALEAHTSKSPLSSHTTWTGSPQSTEYSSPGGSSSRTSPGNGPSNTAGFDRIDHRQAADINLTYRGSVGAVPQTGRQPQVGGNWSTASQAMDIRAPRRCDSNSSISSDHSYSSSPGRQVLQHFGKVGSYHAPSNHTNSQEGAGGSFVGDAQHMELASANQGMDERPTFKGPTSQNFTMMNPNDDILGAARSIQSRSTAAAVDHRQDVHPFHRQGTSSPSHNSNATTNVTVFSSSRYDDHDSPFESREYRGRNRGNISSSTSTGLGIFDQSLTTTSALRTMVDTAAYTRSTSEFFQS